MSLLGDSVSAGVFTNRDDADDAWGILARAGIPATVVTQPEVLGRFEINLLVERSSLADAQEALADFMSTRG